MYPYNPDMTEEEMVEEELKEAETMVRNGASMRQIVRKRFTYLGQSDIVKLLRKYGRSGEDPEENFW